MQPSYARIHEVISLGDVRAAERGRVRSWIFRHRLRLRAIYGPRPEIRPLPPQRERPPRLRSGGLSPGEVGRSGRWYVIRPNPPAA